MVNTIWSVRVPARAFSLFNDEWWGSFDEGNHNWFINLCDPLPHRGIHTRREMFSESCWINPKLDCIYHLSIDLDPNQSENVKYNLILGWLNRIPKVFLYVFLCECAMQAIELCCCSLTHLCRPVRSTCAVRETASLGIMGAPRVHPLNPSETIVLSEHYRLWGV